MSISYSKPFILRDVSDIIQRPTHEVSQKDKRLIHPLGNHDQVKLCLEGLDFLLDLVHVFQVFGRSHSKIPQHVLFAENSVGGSGGPKGADILLGKLVDILKS